MILNLSDSEKIKKNEMKRGKFITTLVFCLLWMPLCAQDFGYAKVRPIKGGPVLIYSDSTRTKVVMELQPEDFVKMSVDVSIRSASSDMLGDKIHIYQYDKSCHVPEFTGWVEKEHCYRSLRIDSDNCSYIYAEPDNESPCMEILSNRGLLVNIMGYESGWYNVKFLYHRVIEGWVKESRMRP